MLRCSNAIALRTSVEHTMALRCLPAARWTKAARGMFYTAPLARATQYGLVRAHPLPWRSVAAVKRYSTEASGSGPAVEESAAVTTTSAAADEAAPPQQPPKQLPKQKRDGGGGSLLEIAMAGTSPAAGATVSKKVVEMELKWLNDPKALADRIARILQAGDVALAVALVRTAQSERMECTVAWNHLLEYCMEKGEAKAAFKFYNEMKKRGRKPNSWTYTIMLKGLSTAKKSMGFNPVTTALSIYRSIYASNSAVKPSIIHSNAMLTVCSRHRDLDTLWEVAGELPEDGPGSPDPLTYTIILRAIQNAAKYDVEKMRPSEIERILTRKAQCVKEGKRIWSDVVYRWSKGQITMDNKLVGGMASLLLEGASERDCYDVFALIYQTTGISNLDRRPPPEIQHISARVGRRETGSRGGKDLEDVPFVDEGNRVYRPAEAETEQVEEEQEEDEDFESLFDPVASPSNWLEIKKGTIRSGAPTHVRAGNRELCMILEACLTMTQGLGVGKAYWNYLTQTYHDYTIEPDSASFHAYLRLLRLSRASRLAVEVVRDQMPNPQAKTFHIALSCCLRDRRNMNVLKNAHELLEVMDKSLVLPHPKALEDYLDMVRVLEDNPQRLMSLNGLEFKRSHWDSLNVLGRKLRLTLLTVSVRHLRPHVAKIQEAMEHGRSLSRPKGQATEAIDGSLALKVLVRTRGLIDAILKFGDDPLISKADLAQYKQEALQLRKYSDAEMANKFQNTLVYPTPAQLMAFQEKHDREHTS